MKLKIILFLCIATLYTNSAFSFLYKITISILNPHQTTITLLFDCHEESLAEQKQTECLLNYLKQFNNNAVRIHIEQATPLNKLFCNSKYEILYKLDEHIKQILPDLAHITLEDIEIRHVIIAAYSFLTANNPTSYDNYATISTGNAQNKTIGTVTFQDLVNELETHKQSLSDYYRQHTNETIIDIYKQHMKKMTDAYEEFKQKLATIPSLNDTVLDYAKTQFYEELSKDIFTEKENRFTTLLAKNLHFCSKPLFELNLLKTILTNKSAHNIVVAGGNHLEELSNMLKKLHANSIYQVHNTIINTEENLVHDEPLASEYITEGLMLAAQSLHTNSPETANQLSL